ncbi:radical SAM protein [Actinomadura sp. WAC 06369]|uniref:radical SAM protein n=1 Tax=Actinomadura sp. WAC 06369 TaxID=2203193 RepID=UPI000F7B2746|nr:radical SAM protein [Actinomadura sp. WAC 06369]RSN46884.1 radical SAM protein [Actinomadura sp. WAC 06369]
MHQLIASPFLGEYMVLKPGEPRGFKIPRSAYIGLGKAAAFPPWLVEAARKAWGMDLHGQPTAESLLIRPESTYAFGKATYELNLGCNYDCEHCYLGLKTFEGLEWPERERLLETIRDAGTLWLQLTGGEPMVDRLFAAVHTKAYELGMMIEILTNGSRLANTKILDLLTTYRPSKMSLSVYGATAETYDGLTRRPGSFRKFMRGLTAAHEAGLQMNLSLIITDRNAHEVDAMRELAERFGLRYREYAQMSPTIHGGGESLPSQSPQYLRKRQPFRGCDAGHTSFHVDPFGKASICKIGRNPNIDLTKEGAAGLLRLGGISDNLLLRQGGCTGCTLQDTCGTCMPLVQLYREAKAPLATYCQHKEPRKEVAQ